LIPILTSFARINIDYSNLIEHGYVYDVAEFTNPSFWPLLVAVIVLIIIISSRRVILGALILLLLFGTFYTIAQFPSIYWIDTLVHASTANKLIEISHIDYLSTHDEYMLYPGAPLLLAISSLVTASDTLSFSNIIVFVIQLLMFLIVVAWLIKINKLHYTNILPATACLAYMYVMQPYLYAFALFLTIGYLIVRNFEENNPSANMCVLLLLGIAIIISHVLTQIYLLFFLIFLLGAKYLHITKIKPPLMLALFVTMIAYHLYIVFLYWPKGLQKVWEVFLGLREYQIQSLNYRQSMPLIDITHSPTLAIVISLLRYPIIISSFLITLTMLVKSLMNKHSNNFILNCFPSIIVFTQMFSTLVVSLYAYATLQRAITLTLWLAILATFVNLAQLRVFKRNLVSKTLVMLLVLIIFIITHPFYIVYNYHPSQSFTYVREWESGNWINKIPDKKTVVEGYLSTFVDHYYNYDIASRIIMPPIYTNLTGILDYGIRCHADIIILSLRDSLATYSMKNEPIILPSDTASNLSYNLVYNSWFITVIAK